MYGEVFLNILFNPEEIKLLSFFLLIILVCNFFLSSSIINVLLFYASEQANRFENKNNIYFLLLNLNLDTKKLNIGNPQELMCQQR